MTQLTKLGDVAAYLRAGDTFRHDRRIHVVDESAHEDRVLTRANNCKHAVMLTDDVELLSPRWVPAESARGQSWDGAVFLSRGKVMTDQEYLQARVDLGVHILCRETAGKLEPVRAEMLTTTTQTPVTGVDSFGNRHTSKPQPDSLPRLVKGSELRVGDEALFPKGKLEMRTVSSIDARGWVHFACGSCIGPEAVVELLSRAEPAYRTATRADEAAPAPQPDPREELLRLAGYGGLGDRLRREWEYLAERTPWDAMAGIYESRQWECSPFVQDTVPLSWELRLAADDLFYRARKDPRLVAEGARMLVVLQPDNRDRPIELFAEALNAAAYHAKVEELWPTAATEAEAPKNCVTCDAMCASGQIECGDCRSGRARRFSNLPPSFTRTENRFRGLPPAPGVRLSPGARYHLADDADAFGIPEHN